MLDRVQISDGENGGVRWTFAGPDGVIEACGFIPSDEWKTLRDNIIDTYPANVSTSLLTDYLAVLGEVIG